MNKYLFRAKIKEIRDAAKDPLGATGLHVSGNAWHTMRGADGYFLLKLKGAGASLKMVIDLKDLYVQGFVSAKGSFKFTDATWDAGAADIGFTSDYRSMGWDRTTFYPAISFADIAMAIDNVANCSTTPQWEAQQQSIVKLVITFVESARMHAIQKCIENGTRIGSVKWDPSNEPALIKT